MGHPSTPSLSVRDMGAVCSAIYAVCRANLSVDMSWHALGCPSECSSNVVMFFWVQSTPIMPEHRMKRSLVTGIPHIRQQRGTYGGAMNLPVKDLLSTSREENSALTLRVYQKHTAWCRSADVVFKKNGYKMVSPDNVWQ